MKLSRIIVALFIALSLAFSASASADEQKVVIQVSSGDPGVQKLALNNAVNLQNALGMDNVIVEVVAYGPGLTMLTDKSTQAQRVSSLAMQNITFSACANTMKAMEKKTGLKPQLVDGVTVVPAGVLRIIELQNEGYAYIRP
jgi:hypothetical protein